MRAVGRISIHSLPLCVLSFVYLRLLSHFTFHKKGIKKKCEDDLIQESIRLPYLLIVHTIQFTTNYDISTILKGRQGQSTLAAGSQNKSNNPPYRPLCMDP